MTAPLAAAGADAAAGAVAGGGEATGAAAKKAPTGARAGGSRGGGGKGKGSAFVSPPRGGGAKHSGGRGPRGRQALVAEFVGCFVILALSPLTDKHKSDSPGSIMKRASAICALFLILGLVSTGGRSAAKLATYFGGLVLVVLLVSERDVFAALAAKFGESGTGPAGPQDSGGGGSSDADFGTGSGPGPAAEAPTTGASVGRAVVGSWFPWLGGGL